MIPILMLLRYIVVKSYERSRVVDPIDETLAQGSRDVEQMTRLLDGPVAPWVGDRNVEQLPSDDKPNLAGFLILQDLRMIDLRNWRETTEDTKNYKSFVYGYRRLKVEKQLTNTTNNDFRVSVLARSPEAQIRFPPQQLEPKVYSRPLVGSRPGEKLVHWEVGANFQKVPAGDAVDIVYEHTSPGTFLRKGAGSTTLAFDVEAETVELTRWLLLPQGRQYRTYQLIRYPTGKPEATENVKVVTEYLAEDYTILAFKLLSVEAGYTYEVTWFYR